MLPADTIAALDARTIDVALCPLDDIPARFATRRLYEEDFIIAARSGHGLGKRPSFERYCSARHLLVSRVGDPHGFVDMEIKKLGYARTIALTVPSFMFALSIVAETDPVAALPRGLLRAQAARFGLVALEPPLPLGRSSVHAVAPTAAMADSDIAWLVDLLEHQLSHASSGTKRAR